MRTFNVLITEKLAGTLEVEANTAEEARQIAQAMITNNDVPDGIMDETDGYKIEDVQQA